MVHALLQAGASTELVAGEHKSTALHLAAARGFVSCVTALLAGGACKGALDGQGRCAAALAAAGGHTLAAEALA